MSVKKVWRKLNRPDAQDSWVGLAKQTAYRGLVLACVVLAMLATLFFWWLFR